MKTQQRILDQDGKIIIHQRHDVTGMLGLTAAMRNESRGDLGKENKLAANVPMKLFYEWAKKWGVNYNDSDAMQDVLARELNDSNNAHLRVWTGDF